MQLANASPLLPMVATAARRSQSMTSLSKLFLRMPSLIVLLRFGKDGLGDAPAQPTKNASAINRTNFMNHPSAKKSYSTRIGAVSELSPYF
jgi:hypothetical protein